jgi:endothelin-converting enzyme/putative endopeptidase
MFPAEAKAKAEKMIHNIILASKSINNLTWMSAETKVKAVEKLNKINIKIGYPDKWKDYSKLDIKVLLRKLFRKHEKIFLVGISKRYRQA